MKPIAKRFRVLSHSPPQSSFKQSLYGFYLAYYKAGLEAKKGRARTKNVYQIDSERLTLLNVILKRRQEDLNVREPLCLKVSNYIKTSTGDFVAACLSTVKSFLNPNTALVSGIT